VTLLTALTTFLHRALNNSLTTSVIVSCLKCSVRKVCSCLALGMYRISGSGWPDIRPFFDPVPVPVPAKMVPGTGYLSRIVLGPFWQLVELSSPDANARVSAFKL